MPFQCVLEDEGKVRLPLEYLKSLNLKKGDMVTLDIVPLLGAHKTTKQLQADLSYEQDFEISLATLNHFLPIWLKNFKENLPFFVSDAKGYADILPTEGDKKRCVVIANGPSLREADLSPLKDFKGTIVTANKPLKYLLDNGIVPDYVCVLDAEEVVLESFIDIKSTEGITGILLPTSVNHKVARWAMENFGKERIYWHNPMFSDATAPNICETLSSITNIPSIEHGGNVGTFSYLIAIRPLFCNPIGLFGFDLSYKPNPKWSLEQACNYRYFYIPDMEHFYVMSPVFEYYLSRLIELWNLSSTQMGVRTMNLTPIGPLNAVVGLKRMGLKEFIES